MADRSSHDASNPGNGQQIAATTPQVPLVIRCVDCCAPEMRWYASFVEDKGWLCNDCAHGEPRDRCLICWELPQFCTCPSGTPTLKSRSYTVTA